MPAAAHTALAVIIADSGNQTGPTIWGMVCTWQQTPETCIIHDMICPCTMIRAFRIGMLPFRQLASKSAGLQRHSRLVTESHRLTSQHAV